MSFVFDEKCLSVYYKMHWELRNIIHTILVGFALLFTMGGGSYLIVHNYSWSMDDACMIQARVGSGLPVHLTDFPGFNPAEGRLFPLAYMHTNLVLLFSGGKYCSAKPFYVQNAIFWVLFVILLFLLSFLLLKEKTNLDGNMAKWMSLLVVLAFGQRVLLGFSVLWTTIALDYLITVAFCLLFLLYLGKTKRNRLIGILMIVLLLYLTFCLELNAVIPLMIAAGLMINRRMFDIVTVSCLSIFLLFVALYVSLILPHTIDFYDSSHGSSDTIMSNAIKELLLQKLLIVILLVFVYRLFVVFVRKWEYDEFSDTLLLASVTYILGGFVLRLQGVYYVIPMLLSMPAMFGLLSFDKTKNKILSYSILLLMVGYYVIKYPKLCESIYRKKEFLRRDMYLFTDKLKDEDDIVWYAEELEDGNMKNLWKKGHVGSNLRYAKQDRTFALKTVEDIKKGVVVLSPKTTNIAPIEYRFPELVFREENKFMSLVMYRVE